MRLVMFLDMPSRRNMIFGAACGLTVVGAMRHERGMQHYRRQKGVREMFKVYDVNDEETIMTRAELKKLFNDTEIKKIIKGVETKINDYLVINYGD